MTKLAALLASLVVVASASAAPPYAVSLLSRGAAPTVGETWKATLLVRRAGKPAAGLTVTVRLTQGARTMSYPAVGLGRGRYSVDVAFPTDGRWAIAARVGKAILRLGAVNVAPEPLRAEEPFDLAVEPAGTLLVADGKAGRLLRVDPAARTVTHASPELGGRVTSVVRDPAGVVYASVGSPRNEVVRIENGGVTRHPGPPGSLALAPDGDLLILVWEGRILRVDSATRELTTFAGRGVDASDGDGGPALAAGLFHPHGAVSAADGSVYVADTYAGKIRRIDAGGTIATIASGLTNPVDVAVDRDGTLVVSEAGGDIKRVGADGRITVVSDDVPGPTGIAIAADGAIYVGGLDGAGVYRIDPATGTSKVTR